MASLHMSITIIIDDKDYIADDGELLTNVMFRENLIPIRHHPIDNSPRAPFCLMGVCFECLVDIADRQSVQACLTPVKEGMRVRRRLK